MSEVVSPSSSPDVSQPRSGIFLSGLSLSGALSLCAVVAVLIVVSVPRLRGLARQENEADAQQTAQILALALADMEASASDLPSCRELLRRPELRGLSDAELLAQGGLLRRHGYLFQVSAVPPALSIPCTSPALLAQGSKALAAVPVIRAWPWACGRTGRSCFLATAEGGTLVHSNRGLRWDGVASSGARLESLVGWARTN